MPRASDASSPSTTLLTTYQPRHRAQHAAMSHIRNSPVGRAVAESMPFILPVAILAVGKALYELVPIQAFAGIVAALSLVLFLRHGRAESPQAKEDDLSSKSRRAQSIAQELEREAASEHAARERKKVSRDWCMVGMNETMLRVGLHACISAFFSLDQTKPNRRVSHYTQFMCAVGRRQEEEEGRGPAAATGKEGPGVGMGGGGRRRGGGRGRG